MSPFRCLSVHQEEMCKGPKWILCRWDLPGIHVDLSPISMQPTLISRCGNSKQGSVLFLCTECSCWVVLIAVAFSQSSIQPEFPSFSSVEYCAIFHRRSLYAEYHFAISFPCSCSFMTCHWSELMWRNLSESPCLRFCLLCLCQVIWEAAGVLSLAIYMVSLKKIILNSLPVGKANLTNQWVG